MEGPAMTMRTNSSTVSFRRPFSLSGIGGLQPPGSYTVETDEEWIDGTSPPAYRRIATMIRLSGRPGTGESVQVVTVDPEELAVALARDAAEIPADSPVPEPAADVRAGDGSPSDPGRGSQPVQSGTARPAGRVPQGWRGRVATNPHVLVWIAIAATGVLVAVFTVTW
jgi:hypothetical protein